MTLALVLLVISTRLFATVESEPSLIDDRELQRGEEITPSSSPKTMLILPFVWKNLSISFTASRQKDHLILPIFYGVEPTHLRHQTGSYGEAGYN